MSARNRPHLTDGEPINTNLLDELAVNPQLLSAVLTPPIAFNPIFVDIAGSLTAGLLLSFVIDEPQSEDWSFLDTERIMRCTRMTMAELRGARQRLKDGGLLRERRVGFPARTEYRVDFDHLKSAIVRAVRCPVPPAADVSPLSGLDSHLH
jgi:hypothetical protein